MCVFCSPNLISTVCRSQSLVLDFFRRNKAMFAFILLTSFAIVDSHIIASKLLQDSDVPLCDVISYRRGSSHRSRRHVVADRTLLWDEGVVPYEIDESLPHLAKFSVKYAINLIQSKTCIRFKQRESTDAHFVKITIGTSCWSYIGRRTIPDKKFQEVSLGPNCFSKGIVLHEIMHLLGFYHEHTRFDRDKYINVLWDNIDPAYLDYFRPVDPSVSSYELGSYDYDSVMHYKKFAHSSNGKPTMEAKIDPGRFLGRQESLSDKDIEKIKKTYNCQQKRLTGIWGDWSPWGKCTGDSLRMRLRKCADDMVVCPNAYFDGFQIQKESC